MAVEVTVGIDIGTTSVKAVAADADGRVVASSRVPHELHASHAGELAHDADAAWHVGVLHALDRLGARPAERSGRADPPELDIRGVQVAAMVPSLCAVDGDGRPVSPGVLYGDERGGGAVDPATGASEELLHVLEWLVDRYPDAAGYWPAQAVANHALAGVGAIDPIVAYLAAPLFDLKGWDAEVAAKAGLHDVGRLPAIARGDAPIGTVGRAGGAPLGGGTIDALGEQLVGGATAEGDVLVILGSTLIVWAVIPEWREVPGLWTVPSMASGGSLIGGPSNAGGLFVGWVAGLLGVDLRPPGPGGVRAPATGDAAVHMPPDDPERVPVWQPYLRGERVPHHDPERRASLHDLDIGLGPGAVLRAAHEASAFAVRHQLDLAGLQPRRIVATGGGVRDGGWVQAIADGTGLPVDVVAVPEGGALGAAWLARQVAGLEGNGADASEWARVDHRVEPDVRWVPAVGRRYERYRVLSG